MKTPASVALAALAAVLAGCSGGGSSQSLCGPTPAVLPAPPMLRSPASGATGVPANGLRVVISYDPAGNGRLRLVDPGGTSLAGSAFVPAPNIVPPFTDDYAASAPPLAAHTTYTVFVDAVFPPSGPCPIGLNGPVSFQLGSFTTS